MNPYDATTTFMRAIASASGFTVSATLPEDATHPGSGEYVTVERTGGGVEHGVDRGTFAVQTWAPTENRACQMAGEIADACDTIMSADPLSNSDYMHICRLDVSNAYSFASGDGWRRWQTVIDAVIQ